MRCRVDVEKIRPLVMQEWLSSSLVRAYFASRTKPAVSQASINRQDVLFCPVPDIGPVEQDEFLSRLGAVDAALREGRARAVKLGSLRRALAGNLLSGGVSWVTERSSAF